MIVICAICKKKISSEKAYIGARKENNKEIPIYICSNCYNAQIKPILC